jgi:hypothetical protein
MVMHPLPSTCLPTYYPYALPSAAQVLEARYLEANSAKEALSADIEAAQRRVGQVGQGGTCWVVQPVSECPCGWSIEEQKMSVLEPDAH